MAIFEPIEGVSAGEGLIFDIRRFSTHDGPGIRTAVFLKGCPLRCKWCQNPEGLEPERRLRYFPNKCVKCGQCVKICPRNALSANAEHPENAGHININTDLCDNCGACADTCPALALALDSRVMTAEQALAEVLKDKVFYGDTGGVTLSGGDPFFQAEFSLLLLKKCRENGLRTAIETSLFVKRDVLERFLPYLDLILADMKLSDPSLHRLYTGRDNALIKDNLRFILSGCSEGGCPVLVRVPLIPGYTATADNLRQIGDFLYSAFPGTRVELINYNPLAYSKYILLGRPFAYEQNPEVYKKEELDRFYDILYDSGLRNFVRE